MAISIEHLRTNIAQVHERMAIACLRSNRPVDSVRLIVVTKMHPAEIVQQVINCGISDIGENRVQEIVEKQPQLKGCNLMHLIGHLQTNKVSKVVPLVEWIHSIDSERVLSKIGEQAVLGGKVINGLVQVNTSGEDSKDGCTPDQCLALCEKAVRTAGVIFRGLMTIGPLGASEAQTRQSFTLLRTLGDQCQEWCDGQVELSMGMSNDFEWAIEEGATMVRVGSLIVGERSSL